MSEKNNQLLRKKRKNNQNFFLTILEKVKNWFSLLWTGYTIEVQDRIFMSWKRIIKFIGIALIPIIYGVVCLVAFWNPIAGMGKVPVAIMNSGDQNIILVENTEQQDDNTTLVKIGALVNPDSDAANNWDSPDATVYTPGNDLASLVGVIQSLESGKTYFLNNGLSFTYSPDTTQLMPISMWEFMKSLMLPKTNPSIADEDYTFKTRTIFQGMALENIHYISDPQKISDQWQGSKYYVQAKLEKNYTANLFGYLGSVINQNQTSTSNKIAADSSSPRTPSDWKDILTKMDIWTTFERNFIFGYYMQTFSTFSSGLMLQVFPDLINSFSSDYSVSGAEINAKNGTNLPAEFINPKENYVLLRSGEPNLSNVGMTNELWNEPKLRDLTLFGNLKEDGSIIQTGQVGGKIVNLLEKLKLLNSTGIFDAIPLSSNTRQLLNNIFKVLKVVSSEDLDSYIYRGITGQWNPLVDLDVNNGNPTTPTQLMHALVLQLLGKIGFSLPNPNDLSTITSFLSQITIIPVKDSTYAGKPPVLPKSIFETIFGGFMQKNPTVFDGSTKIEDLSSIVINKWLGEIIGSPRIDDFVSFTERGSENGIYGIGLGQFFLVIGIWIGILMHTFVFDRAKRYSKATPSTWYLSKTLLMISVALIQATLEVWVAYLCGWHQIGIEATLLMWLWFMASAIMFVVLIQGLWFVVKDETIGKFIVIIIMVLSLAAGGGTFPALAQFKFFTVINHVVPFTYVLKGLGAIVYGVGSVGATASSTAVILKSFGAFFVYIAIFGSLGLFIGSRNRFKEMSYGSHYGKCVALAMIALKRDSDVTKFRTIKKTTKKGKNKYQYHWNKLEPGLDLELYLKVRTMFPFEGRFKWWERKHHDPVQKPNYSDEDIMSRNE